jgi:hypothetical protein
MNKKAENFPFALILINLFLFSGIYELFWGIPHLLKYIFSVAALIIIFQFYFSSRKNNIESNFDKVIINLFIIVSIGLLVNSLRFDTFYIQEVFGERYFFVPYLLPIIFMRSKYDLFFFKNVLKYTNYLIIPAIITQWIVLFFFRDIYYYVPGMTAIYTLSLAPMLLIFVSFYLNEKRIKYYSLLYFISFALLCAIWGRRGETLEPLYFVVTPFIMKILSKEIALVNRTKTLMFFLLFLSISIFTIIQNYESFGFAERGGFTQNAFDQSRGETVDAFFSDFGTKPYDYMFGRGLNALITKFFSGDNMLSRTIEIGYLNILLKGGLLYLLPMLYLFIRSIYLGLFRSYNYLSKGLAFIVLWHVIYMSSFAMANFSPYYILVWIGVAANFDRSIREKTNQELNFYFKGLKLGS